MGKDSARVGRGIGRLKVVDDVVNVLGVGFGQGLTVVRADPEIAVEGVGADLDVRAELLADRISNDAVLHSEIGRAHGVHAVKLPVFKRAVVQDDVVPRPHVQGAFARVRILVTLAKTDVADDDVAFSAQRYFSCHKADTPTRGRLALNGKVAAHRNRGKQDDISTDVEHDDAVARADGVAKRSRARIVQVGDVVDRPAPASSGHGPESKGSRECRDLRFSRRGLECEE